VSATETQQAGALSASALQSLVKQAFRIRLEQAGFPLRQLLRLRAFSRQLLAFLFQVLNAFVLELEPGGAAKAGLQIQLGQLFRRKEKDHRTAVADLLKSAKSPHALLVLDDVDRLLPSEAVSFVTTLRGWLGVPGVVVLVPCDRQELTRLIAVGTRLTDSDAHRYLQKFIGEWTHMPDVGDTAYSYATQLGKRLQALCEAVGLRSQLEENLWTIVVRPLVKTFREQYRIEREFESHLNQARGYVDPDDLLCVKVLSVVAPDVHALLMRNRSVLVGFVPGGEQDLVKELSQLSSVSCLHSDEQRAIATIVCHLFPNLREHLGKFKIIYRPAECADPHFRKRAYLDKYFSRHFSLAPPPDDELCQAKLQQAIESGVTPNLTSVLAGEHKTPRVGQLGSHVRRNIRAIRQAHLVGWFSFFCAEGVLEGSVLSTIWEAMPPEGREVCLRDLLPTAKPDSLPALLRIATSTEETARADNLGAVVMRAVEELGGNVGSLQPSLVLRYLEACRRLKDKQRFSSAFLQAVADEGFLTYVCAQVLQKSMLEFVWALRHFQDAGLEVHHVLKCCSSAQKLSVPQAEEAAALVRWYVSALRVGELKLAFHANQLELQFEGTSPFAR
jgi:hypothetical protein